MVVGLALLALRIGLVPVSDNSALIHIRTGIDLWQGSGIPRSDPYSFTAAGQPWVVQSWLASAVYGLAHRAGGFGWVAATNGLLTGLLGLLMVRLARTGRPLRTLTAGVVVLGIGFAFWAPRPLLFGLLGLVLTVTVVERRTAGAWLVPVVWCWANTHGSFPLGVVWILAVSGGVALDGRSLRAATAEFRYLAWFGAGLAAAAVNPLGPRILSFAATVGEKREIFERVVEWQSPDFQRPGGTIALVALTVMLMVVMRGRPRGADVVPLAAFLGAALLASRNLPMLAVVVAPILGRCLRVAEPHVDPPERAPIHAALAGVVAVVAMAFVVQAARGPGLDLDDYPVAAVRRLEAAGRFDPPHRTATPDRVGALVILRQGRQRAAFVDDRVDMFPLAVSRDYLTLLDGRPGALQVLDRYGVDTVLWERTEPLVPLLQARGGWRETVVDGDYVVLERSV